MDVLSKMEPTFRFTDPAWRRFPRNVERDLNLASNELWFNNDTKAGVLVCPQADKYPDHIASKSGLDYLHDAKQNGKISEGYVVLSRWTDAKREVVSVKPIDEVVASLLGIQPNQAEALMDRSIGSLRRACRRTKHPFNATGAVPEQLYLFRPDTPLGFKEKKPKQLETEIRDARMMKNMMRRKDVLDRFDEIENLLLKAKMKMWSLGVDVWKNLDHLHRLNEEQITFNFDGDNNEQEGV